MFRPLHAILLAVLTLIPASLMAQDIFTAVQQNDTTTVLALLDEDSSLANAHDNAGRAPLHFAVNSGNLPMVNLLVKRGADPLEVTHAGTGAMHYAAVNGSVEIGKRLQELGVPLDDANGQGIHPLYYAARMGKQAFIQLLLEQGADIEARTGAEQTAIHAACQGGSMETVQALLDAGADLSATDRYGRDAVEFALSSGKQDIAEKLLALNPKPASYRNDLGQTYLHNAVEGRSPNLASLLIAKGVPLNAQDVYRMTPLDYAYSVDDSAMIAMLEGVGAKRNKRLLKPPKGDYLGAKKPGNEPQLFKPGFISTPTANERDIQFTLDDDRLYFTRWTQGNWDVNFTDHVGKKWTDPQPASFCTPFTEAEAYLTPDNQTLFFISNRPESGNKPQQGWDLFFTRWQGEDWGEVERLGGLFTGGFYTSFTSDGTMYLTLNELQQRAKPNGEGGYLDPEPLPEEVNFMNNTYNSFVAPDESYLLYTTHHESNLGAGDLYICFRREDDTWSEAINLGSEINSFEIEYCPWVSKEGKYLFFTSRRYGNEDIFWVSAEVIERLRKESGF